MKIFAAIEIPDGYFGDTLIAGLALIKNTPVAVHEFGYHSLGMGDCIDEREVLWRIENDSRLSYRIKIKEVK